jgi:molybdopterin converting factor small subunit
VIGMPDVHLPTTLLPLFSGLPRRLEVEAATVGEAIDDLDRRWPGLRARLCEPGPRLRPHINVYVDRQRGDLDTPLTAAARMDVIAAISGG